MSSRAYIDKLLKTTQDTEQSDWEKMEQQYKQVIQNLRQQIRKQGTAVSIDLYKAAVDDGKQRASELRSSQKKVASLTSKVAWLERLIKEKDSIIRKSVVQAAKTPQKQYATNPNVASPTDFLEQGLLPKAMIQSTISSPTLTKPKKLVSNHSTATGNEASQYIKQALSASQSDSASSQQVVDQLTQNQRLQNQHATRLIETPSIPPPLGGKPLAKKEERQGALDQPITNEHSWKISSSKAPLQPEKSHLLVVPQRLPLRAFSQQHQSSFPGKPAPSAKCHHQNSDHHGRKTINSDGLTQERKESKIVAADRPVEMGILDWVDNYTAKTTKTQKEESTGVITVHLSRKDSRKVLAVPTSDPMANIAQSGNANTITNKQQQEQTRRAGNVLFEHERPGDSIRAQRMKTRTTERQRQLQISASQLTQVEQALAVLARSHPVQPYAKVEDITKSVKPDGMRNDENAEPNACPPLQKNKDALGQTPKAPNDVTRSSIRMSKVRAAGGRRGLQEKLKQIRSPPMRKAIGQR